MQIITIEDELYVFEQFTRTRCDWVYVPFEVQLNAFVVSENVEDIVLNTLNNAIDTNMQQIIDIQVGWVRVRVWEGKGKGMGG